jgi:Flp pilus assembly protein TadG
MSNDLPSSPPGRPPRRFRRALLARFRRDASGVTAVEFGLVALPFFAVLFAILEVSLAFWTSQVMESMVADASRQVYTGQFQQANQGKSAAQMAEAFKDLICGTSVVDGRKVNRFGLFDCHGKLQVDVRAYTSFQGRSRRRSPTARSTRPASATRTASRARSSWSGRLSNTLSSFPS